MSSGIWPSTADHAHMRPVYRQARHAAWLGVVTNLALGGGKLVGGMLGQSFALMSDAVHSLSDVFTSAMVLVGMRISQKPADAGHPYGHTRAESIVASNVAVLLVLSAVWLGWRAAGEIGSSHPTPARWTLWIALASVVVKEALYQYKVRVGRRLHSSSIVADAWHHRSDAFSSLAVLAGLAVVRFGGPAWSDDVAALVVAASILWAGVMLFREGLHELMDRQVEADFVRQVREVAGAVAGVAGVEKVWVRKAGLEYSVDLHIEVDPDMSVRHSHELAHHVREVLLDAIVPIRNVLVHVEPSR